MKISIYCFSLFFLFHFFYLEHYSNLNGYDIILMPKTAIVDDLLDLYTNHRSYTLVGTQYDSNTYLTHRIELNKERQTHGNGHHKHNGNVQDSLNSPPNDVCYNLANGQVTNATDRGTHGTVRFMIDPSRERSERHLLDRHAHDSNGTGASPSNASS